MRWKTFGRKHHCRSAPLRRHHVRRAFVLQGAASTPATRLAPKIERIARRPLRTAIFLATIHRAGNTDDPQKLSAIVDALAESPHPIVLPLHPRTRKMLQQFNIELSHNIHIVPPVGYLDMLQLELNAAAIITDSGGVQKKHTG